MGHHARVESYELANMATLNDTDCGYQIVLDGLSIFGASILTNTQSHYLVLQNLEVRFPWRVQRLPPLFWTSATPGIDLRGNDNVLRDSVLAYSAGRMISLSGDWRVYRQHHRLDRHSASSDPAR